MFPVIAQFFLILNRKKRHPFQDAVIHYKYTGFKIYFLGNCKAACAAANLAIGTRKGEQLT